jgi:23S rRNA (adenine2503-C2)-methyltransferase
VPLNLASLAPPPEGGPVPLRALLPEDIRRRFAHLGVDAGASRRLFAAFVGRYPAHPAEVRGVRKAVLEAILRESDLSVPELVDSRTAADGFAKHLMALGDGSRVEAVWIPLDRPLASLCLSSMVGCPLACAFCATGRRGFTRSLTAAEMVGQFLRLRTISRRPVSSAVFMGMGEPLLNYDAVIRAACVLSYPGGGGISSRSISIGTAGVVPAIRRFTAERHPFRLIISLTAADPAKRRELMPHEAAWPLDELADAVRERARLTGDRVTLAWVMIRGVNTGPDDVEDLRRLLGGVPLVIDLIDVQDTGGSHRPPDDFERLAFRDALTRALGQPVIRRYSGGAEIGAACGMLTGGLPG